MEHMVVSLSANGTIRSFRMDHRKVRYFFGNEDIGFCGAIDELRVVAMARTERRENDALNMYSLKYPRLFEKSYGDILLLGSDKNGEACDVSVSEITKIILENDTLASELLSTLTDD